MTKTLKEMLREQVGRTVGISSPMMDPRDYIKDKGIMERKYKQWKEFECEHSKKYPGFPHGTIHTLDTVVNQDGSIPIYGFYYLQSINSTDLSIGLKTIIDYYPYEAKKFIDRIIDLNVKSLSDIDRVISNYKAGIKPNVDEVFTGGSISEPYLQSGTPREGLTPEFLCISGPAAITLKDKQNSPFNFPEKEIIGNDSFYILFGDIERIRTGRYCFDKYLRFISDNLIADPSIRPDLYKSRYEEQEFENAVQRYIDIEWGRKDEAISLAQKLMEIYTKKLEWLNSVRLK